MSDTIRGGLSAGRLMQLMGALRAFGLYVGLILVLAAAAAYPVHTLVTFFFGFDPEFQNVVEMLLKLFALAGLWPLMRALKLTGRQHWGYGAPAGVFLREFTLGIAFGAATLLVLVLVLMMLGVREMGDRSELAGIPVGEIALSVIVSALIIGCVEETWFRGALQSAAERYVTALQAGVMVAVFYAAVHFVNPQVRDAGAGVDWWTGFDAIGLAFRGFVTLSLMDSFLALTAAGFLLALFRIRTGSIAQSIGVHAGWVMVIKLIRETTNLNMDSPWTVLVGGYDGVIGYLAFGWFALLSAGYLWLYLKPRQESRAEAFPRPRR